MADEQSFANANLTQKETIRVLRAENDRLKYIQQRQEVQVAELVAQNAELVAQKVIMQEKLLRLQEGHDIQVAIDTAKREYIAAARAHEATRLEILELEAAAEKAGRVLPANNEEAVAATNEVPPGDGEEVADDGIAAASSDEEID